MGILEITSLSILNKPIPNKEQYRQVIDQFSDTFSQRLKTVLLFGSRAWQEAGGDSDHDLFLVIDGLPSQPIKRLKEVRIAIREIPLP